MLRPLWPCSCSRPGRDRRGRRPGSVAVCRVLCCAVVSGRCSMPSRDFCVFCGRSRGLWRVPSPVPMLRHPHAFGASCDCSRASWAVPASLCSCSCLCAPSRALPALLSFTRPFTRPASLPPVLAHPRGSGGGSAFDHHQQPTHATPHHPPPHHHPPRATASPDRIHSTRAAALLIFSTRASLPPWLRHRRTR